MSTTGNPGISRTSVDAPGKFITSNVIFACQAIFSTLYVWKSLGKWDHYDVLYGLLGKNLLESFKNISWISPGNWLCWICIHPAALCPLVKR